MTSEAGNFKTRLRDELAQLRDRLDKLDAFLRSEASDALPGDEQERLIRQREHMAQYASVLAERAQRLGLE